VWSTPYLHRPKIFNIWWVPRWKRPDCGGAPNVILVCRIAQGEKTQAQISIWLKPRSGIMLGFRGSGPLFPGHTFCSHILVQCGSTQVHWQFSKFGSENYARAPSLLCHESYRVIVSLQVQISWCYFCNFSVLLLQISCSTCLHSLANHTQLHLYLPFLSPPSSACRSHVPSGQQGSILPQLQSLLYLHYPMKVDVNFQNRTTIFIKWWMQEYSF
jgi:hypothetical protein